PGQDAGAELTQRLREHRLTPTGVLLTHGHFDHVLAAGEVCAEHQVPAWIHPDDGYMLTDPAAAIGPMGKQLFGDDFSPQPPTDIRDLTDGMRLHLAGMSVDVLHTPGHTGGAVVFSVAT